MIDSLCGQAVTANAAYSPNCSSYSWYSDNHDWVNLDFHFDRLLTYSHRKLLTCYLLLGCITSIICPSGFCSNDLFLDDLLSYDLFCPNNLRRNYLRRNNLCRKNDLCRNPLHMISRIDLLCLCSFSASALLGAVLLFAVPLPVAILGFYLMLCSAYSCFRLKLLLIRPACYGHDIDFLLFTTPIHSSAISQPLTIASVLWGGVLWFCLRLVQLCSNSSLLILWFLRLYFIGFYYNSCHSASCDC